MNTTTYADGSTEITYHRSADEALAKAALDLAKSNVASTSQRVIDPYGPCPCGSGAKFKFCCRAKVR